MNNRLNIQDLAGLLSERTGKDRGEVERFLRFYLGYGQTGILQHGAHTVKNSNHLRWFSFRDASFLVRNKGKSQFRLRVRLNALHAASGPLTAVTDLRGTSMQLSVTDSWMCSPWAASTTRD